MVSPNKIPTGLENINPHSMVSSLVEERSRIRNETDYLEASIKLVSQSTLDTKTASFQFGGFLYILPAITTKYLVKELVIDDGQRERHYNKGILVNINK